jgi:hypothetical protein
MYLAGKVMRQAGGFVGPLKMLLCQQYLAACKQELPSPGPGSYHGDGHALQQQGAIMMTFPDSFSALLVTLVNSLPSLPEE